MDTIANMLTTIRNAQAVNKEMVSVPYSKIKMEIAKILEREKFVEKAERKGKKNKKVIDINLAYADKEPVITDIKRVSKLSKRIYLPASKIKIASKQNGMQIISTSKGVLTDKEAKKENVGGEVLLKIW